MNKSKPLTDYWVFRLDLRVLLRIIKKIRRSPIGKLTYIHSNRTASMLLTILSHLKFIPISLHKIQPRSGPAGPVFNLSEVRDDHGRVITFDAFRAVLKIRGVILSDLLKRLGSLPFVSKKSSADMLEAWLGMKIAAEITPLIYLNLYGRWKHYHKGEEEERKNILVIPRRSWNDCLIPSLLNEPYLDEIWGAKNWRSGLKIQILVFKHLVRSLASILRGHKKRPRAIFDSENPKKSRILVQYSMGIKTTQRNDIPFVRTRGFDLSRLFILIRSSQALPEAAEIRWMKENGIACFSALHGSKTDTKIPKWHPGKMHKREMALFSREYLKFSLACLKNRRKYSLWLLHHFWEMGKKVSFWKDFFISNRVRTAVYNQPSAPQFLINLALSEVGGISIEMERSILFGYRTFMHICPCNIKFVTGPYTLGQIPEPSYSQLTLQSGSIHMLEDTFQLSEARTSQKKGRVVLAVFDELPGDWFFGDSIRQLYQAVSQLILEDDRFFLIVKTKKPQVLERLKQVREDLLRLQHEGKCSLLDWKTSVAAAALSADVSVSAPSTAMFESVLSKKPTLVYNPMRAPIRLFYKNGGLNRRIFEDSKSLTAALKRFADGDPSVGECLDLVSEIDPFDDGGGPERIGSFVMRCLEGLDEGLSQEAVLKKLGTWYAETWDGSLSP